jgi:hypothetical protein
MVFLLPQHPRGLFVMASIPLPRKTLNRFHLNHHESLMQKRHTLRKAAAMHDPPLPGPFVTLSRSEEAESGTIQQLSLML